MRALTRIVFALSLLASLSVFAAKMGEFKETRSSAEELERAKRGAKYNMGSWSGDSTAEVAPFPWMAAGLAVIVLIVAAPFALKMYSNTSKDITAAQTFGAQGSREGSDEEQA